jgi:anti-sigma factor RsiW
MTPDDCARMEAEISALLDGELAGPDAAAVEAHVRSCPACAVRARDLAAVGRTLRSFDASAPAAPVSPGFRARVLSRVAADRRSSRPAPVHPGPVHPGPVHPGPVHPGPVHLGPSHPHPVHAGRWTVSWERVQALFPAVAAAASFVAVLSVGVLLGGTLLGSALLGRVLVPVATDAPRTDAGLSAGPGRPPSALDLLAFAEGHRLQGRTDLERRDVLAALGLSPDDPAVRRACAATFGFDPSDLLSPVPEAPAMGTHLPAGPLEGAGPYGTGADGAGAGGLEAAVDFEGPYLLIGSMHLLSPGAYDAFAAFRERSEELELARAARDGALARDSTTLAATRHDPAVPDPLSRALASLTVGAPVGGDGSASYQGISVFPLRYGGAEPLPSAEAILSLPEALETGKAEALENPGRGDSTVLVSNLDPARPLLVLAGDVLKGGRADRMVTRDVLLAPGARGVPVGVYSVLAGKGGSRSFGSRFREVAGVGGSRLRGLAMAQSKPEDFQRFLRGRLSLLDISALRSSLATAYSERGPAAPYLRSVKPQVADLLRVLQSPEVLGFAVAQGQEILALEVFGSHELLLREAPRILQGCALEATTYQGGGRPPARDSVEAMLAAAGRGTAFRGAGGDPGDAGMIVAEGGLLGSGVARAGLLVHAAVLRGAAAAGWGSRGGKGVETPPSGDKPASSSGSGSSDGGTAGSGGSTGSGGGDTSSGASGGNDGKPADPPTPRDPPR